MPELSLDPKTTALVLIDLQNGIVGMPGVAPHPAAQVLENARRLSAAFRAKGAPVVYVHVDFNDFLQLPVDRPMTLGGGPFPAALSEIAAEAGKEPGDVLVSKRHWGAFAGTGLEQQLRSRGVETVVIGGISTNAGVESTVRQGTGLGFAFVIAEDACSAQSAEEHAFTLERILPRISRVRAVAEVVEALG